MTDDMGTRRKAAYAASFACNSTPRATDTFTVSRFGAFAGRRIFFATDLLPSTKAEARGIATAILRAFSFSALAGGEVADLRKRPGAVADLA
jgi:hypothetical protein